MTMTAIADLWDGNDCANAGAALCAGVDPTNASFCNHATAADCNAIRSYIMDVCTVYPGTNPIGLHARIESGTWASVCDVPPGVVVNLPVGRTPPTCDQAPSLLPYIGLALAGLGIGYLVAKET